MEYEEVWLRPGDGGLVEATPGDATEGDVVLGKLVRDSSRMFRAVISQNMGVDTGIVIIAIQESGGGGACGVALSPDMQSLVIERLRQTADVLEANDHRPKWN